MGLAWAFALTRLLTGAGEAASYPNANKIVAWWTPARERGLGSSFLLGGVGAGGILAPLLFAATNQLAKDRESSYEDLLGDFYGLLSDLLELSAGLKSPHLRNPHLAKELEALARTVNSDWVIRAISGIDELAAGARRNLNRQLGMDALAASLSPTESSAALRR